MLKSETEGFIETRGAKPLWADKNKFAEYLEEVENGNSIMTSYMKSRLLDEGYIKIVLHDSNGMRGRPGSHIEFTTKAKRVMSLAKARKEAARKKLAISSKGRLAKPKQAISRAA